MKKIISLTLAMLMLISIFAAVPITANAEDDDYDYDILEDGTAIITYFYSDATSVTVPSELDGYTVTQIGEEAFECDEAQSITIPAGIKSINSSAFVYCSSVSYFVVDMFY